MRKFWQWVSDAIAVLALAFLLWAGLWAIHIFGG